MTLRDIISPAARRWAYGTILTTGPLLVAYGVLDAATWPLWAAWAESVLGLTLALANVPTTGQAAASTAARRAASGDRT